MKQKTKKPYKLRIKELERIGHLFYNLKDLPYELRSYKKYLSDEELQTIVDVEKMCDDIAEKISTIQLFKYSVKQKYHGVVEIVKPEWMDGYFDSNNKDIIQVKNVSDTYDAYLNRVPAWCWKDYDPKNAYLGKLYNGYCVNKKILQIPKGYRLPTKQDIEVTVALYRDTPAQCIADLQLKLEGIETISTISYKFPEIYLLWSEASTGRRELMSLEARMKDGSVAYGSAGKYKCLPIKLIKEEL